MIYQRLKSLLTQQKFLKNSLISSTHTFETLSRSIINNTNFCKCVTRPFRCMHVNCFNQLRYLADVSTKLQKMHFLDNLRTITPGGSMKSVLCFVLPPEPNTHSFLGSSSWTIYTFHSQDQTFLMHCSFSGSNHQQHRQAKWKQKANCFRAFKNSSFHKYQEHFY